MKRCIYEIRSDLYRYEGRSSFREFLYVYRTNRLFRLTVWLRIAQYFMHNPFWGLSLFSRLIYHKICSRCSVDFPITVKVGLGIKINHGMGLVVNSKSIIGNNVMLSHTVTLATEKGLAPIVGDRVRFAPGVVLVGGVEIGDDSILGANCVVTKSVPANTTAVGIPNKNIPNSFREFTDRFYFPLDKNK